MSLGNIGFVLVLIAAIINGIGLSYIPKMKIPVAERKKNYLKWHFVSLIFLIPGAGILIYDKLFM